MTKEEKIAQYKQIGFSWATQQEEFRMTVIQTADNTDSMPAYPPMKEYRKALYEGYNTGLLAAKNRGDFADHEEETAEGRVGRMAANASAIMFNCDISYGNF